MNPNDPKGAAGALKTPLGLIPPYAMEQTAWVHKLGSDKYGPYNWRKTGVCASTYVNAILRHLNAWRDGETLDPESGISHLAHVACSCNILLDADHCGTLQDDRNVKPNNELNKITEDLIKKWDKEKQVRKMDRPEPILYTEYRLLKVGEIIQEGDEHCDKVHLKWHTVCNGIGKKVRAHFNDFRRKVQASNEPEECSCGRYKIRHFTMGLICEDCEWHGEPY